MKREELVDYLDGLLVPGKFRDYCPNGLQVEGRPEVQHLLAGVSASQSLLDVAVARGADAVLVHHGWFWRGDDLRVTGLRNPCVQIDRFRPGMMAACLDRAPDGSLIRKTGVMGIVVTGGDIAAGDDIAVAPPPGPHRRLEPV